MEFECGDPCPYYNKWSTTDCKCLACRTGVTHKPNHCVVGRDVPKNTI